MRLPSSTHPYIALRLRLAHHALLQFAASLASSMEIVVFLAGPVLLALLSVIALPGFLAMTLPWPAALGLLCAQSLAHLPARLAAAQAIVARALSPRGCASCPCRHACAGKPISPWPAC